MAPKICVVTARFGLQDPIAAPLDGVDFAVCVTDYPANVSFGWNCRLQVGDAREARRIKLHPWDLYSGDVDWFLWLDSNMRPKAPLRAIIPAALAQQESVIVSPHPQRNCVYRELAACERLRKDRPDVMRAQVERYRQEGMPEKFGLAETGLLMLKNDAQAREFCRLWYAEIKYGSVRDQLSFPYVAWKHKLAYGLFPLPARELYVTVTRHVPLQRPA